MSADAPRRTQTPLASTPEQPSAARPAGVLGLHHVATVSHDVARSADFYGRILGLRDLGRGTAPMRSANEGNALVEASARFFGDGHGTTNGLIAVIEQPSAPAGAPGIGGTHHFALGVPDRETLLRWKRRFLDEGYKVNGILDRHYFQSIYVQDPDGTIVELATRGPGWTIDEEAEAIGEAHRAPPEEMLNTNRDRARIAAENWHEAVPEISERMRIDGLHHVTAIGESIERTQEFVAGRLGMRRVKRTSNFDDAASFHWYWGVGDGRPGTLVTYFERSPSRERPARMGSGQISHFAVATPDSAIEPLRAVLTDARVPVSPVAEFGPDAARFNATATQDPDGQTVMIAAPRNSSSQSAAASREGAR